MNAPLTVYKMRQGYEQSFISPWNLMLWALTVTGGRL